MKSTCTFCQKIIVGRTDKRFCSSTCRTHYHNEKNRNAQVILQASFRKVKKNYQILESAFKNGTTEISKYKLDLLEFHSGFATYIYEASKGKFRFYCGEYFYETLPSGAIVLGKDTMF